MARRRRSSKRRMRKRSWISGQKPWAQLVNEQSALGPISIVKQMVVTNWITIDPSTYNNEFKELFYLNYLNYQHINQGPASGKSLASRHQPRGFHELSLRYTNYEVLYCKLELWFNVFSESENAAGSNRYHNSIPIRCAFIPAKFEDGETANATQIAFPNIKPAIFENVGIKDLGFFTPIPDANGTANNQSHMEYRVGTNVTNTPSGRMAQIQKMHYASISFKPTDIAPNMSAVEKKVTELDVEPALAPAYNKGGFQPVGVNFVGLSMGDGLGEGTVDDVAAFDNKISFTGFYRMTYKVRWSGRVRTEVSDII